MTKYLYTAFVRDRKVEEDKPEPYQPGDEYARWQAVAIHPDELTNATWTLPNCTRLVFHAQDSYDANLIISTLLDEIPDDHERIIHYESIEEVIND